MRKSNESTASLYQHIAFNVAAVKHNTQLCINIKDPQHFILVPHYAQSIVNNIMKIIQHNE